MFATRAKVPKAVSAFLVPVAFDNLSDSKKSRSDHASLLSVMLRFGQFMIAKSRYASMVERLCISLSRTIRFGRISSELAFATDMLALLTVIEEVITQRHWASTL